MKIKKKMMKMKKAESGLEFFGGLVIFVIMVVIFYHGAIVFHYNVFRGNTTPYKQGQIDAINGKVYFELVDREDGSKEWSKIAEGE